MRTVNFCKIFENDQIWQKALLTMSTGSFLVQFVEFVWLGWYGGCVVFEVAEFESAVKIEVTPFLDTLTPIFELNLGVTRERWVVWGRRCIHRISSGILHKNTEHWRKFWHWTKFSYSRAIFRVNLSNRRQLGNNTYMHVIRFQGGILGTLRRTFQEKTRSKYTLICSLYF